MPKTHLAFTLVELMMAVAVVAVLAAIAVPYLHDAQLRAHFAEVPVTVDGIESAGTAYALDVVNGCQIASGNSLGPKTNPSQPYGRHARPWEAGTIYDAIGFTPTGDVWANYGFGAGWSGSCTGWFLTVQADMDGDGAGIELTAGADDDDLKWATTLAKTVGGPCGSAPFSIDSCARLHAY